VSAAGTTSGQRAALIEQVFSARMDKDEPPVCENTPTALTPPSDVSGREVLGMHETIPRPTDNTPQACRVLFDAPSRMPTAAGRHWFVADEHGLYCLACALPRRNSRHAPRGGGDAG
jgi:hypothetical protein